MAISKTGIVWAADDPKQLLRYENGEWQVFDASHLPVVGFSGVLPDERGGVFVTSYVSPFSQATLIYHFDGTTWKEVVRSEKAPQSGYYYIRPARLIGDKLWFGSDAGLLIYDLACAGLVSSLENEPSPLATAHVQPNPSTGWAKVSWNTAAAPSPAKNLILYDLLGKTALSQSVSPDAVEAWLDLNALPQGVYYGVLTDENQRGLFGFKVVRQ